MTNNAKLQIKIKSTNKNTMRIIRSSYKGIKGSMFLVYLPYCTVKSKLSYHYFAFRTKAHKAVKRKLKNPGKYLYTKESIEPGD